MEDFDLTKIATKGLYKAFNEIDKIKYPNRALAIYDEIQRRKPKSERRDFDKIHFRNEPTIFSEVFIGLLIIAAGILIQFHPTVYGHQIPRTVGRVVLFIGIFSIVYVIVNSDKILAAKETVRLLICKGCLSLYYKKDARDFKCPKCMNELEELDGFYERNPELKTNW